MASRFHMRHDIENEWDAYVAKLSSMGLDDLLAIYQQQYNRYLTTAGK